MKIIGLDLSLSETGLVQIENDKKTHEELIRSKPTDYEHLKNKDAREIARILDILDRIIFFIDVLKTDFVVIEGASLHSFKTRSLFTLGKLHGLVEMALVKKRIDFKIVPPSSLKKFITGKGNAKKELMLLKVYKKYNEEFDNNNLCDAFALAKYGESFNQSK